MAKYGKWIGAGLGLALGGPLGALFGLFIGSMFDNIQTIAIRIKHREVPPVLILNLHQSIFHILP